jgi:hypothetical protein
MVDVAETLEKWGGVLVGAVGDKILVGIILGLLNDVTPGDIYKCITQNLTIAEVCEEDWEKYRGFAKKAHVQQMDFDAVVEKLKRQLQKRRPDLYGLVDNMPDNQGWTWLESQIKGIKEKLGAN